MAKGRKRTVDSGRVDSLGRPIKVSGVNTNHNAKSNQLPKMRISSDEKEVLEDAFIDYENVTRGQFIEVDGEDWSVLESYSIPYPTVLIESPNGSTYVSHPSYSSNFVEPVMTHKSLVTVHPVTSHTEVEISDDDFLEKLAYLRGEIKEMCSNNIYLNADYRLKNINTIEDKFNRKVVGRFCTANDLYSNYKNPDQDIGYGGNSHWNNASAKINPFLSQQILTIGGREFICSFESNSEGYGVEPMEFHKVDGKIVLKSNNGEKIHEIDYEDEVVEWRHNWSGDIS